MSEHKYLSDGRIVRILSRLEGKRVVVEIGRTYENDEGDDGELFFSGTEMVDASEVHDKPIVDAYAPEITRLEAEQRAANEMLVELRQQITLTERRIESLKAYEPLKRIEEFLAGKITHFVEYRDWCSDLWLPAVITLEQAHDGEHKERRWGDQQRLLALYGRKDRSMVWKLNRYSDPSGSGWTVVEPFCSEAEAFARAREIVADSFGRMRDEQIVHYGKRLVNCAKACGAPIPEGFGEKVRRAERKSLEDMVAKADAERAKWQAQLDALEATDQVPA